ncbi:MAG: hypothetical protein M0P16_10080, partial [Syntrophales bacterium]|nr:hypothetical protein [Syntrophales bacterium]
EQDKSQEVFVRTILATFLAILFILPVSASGEIQTITQNVKQTFGGSQPMTPESQLWPRPSVRP